MTELAASTVLKSVVRRHSVGLLAGRVAANAAVAAVAATASSSSSFPPHRIQVASYSDAAPVSTYPHRAPLLEHAHAVDLSHTILRARRASSADSPILIHHCLMGSKRNWKGFAETLRKLNTDRTVVTVDARNHGCSGHTADLSYDLMVHDVATFIDDHLYGAPVTFIGHGMGGKVGIGLALARPDLMHSLLCIDTPLSAAPFRGAASATDEGDDDFESVQWRRVRAAARQLLALQPHLLAIQSDVHRRLAADKAVETIIADAYQRSLLLSNMLDGRQMQMNQSDKQLFALNLHALVDNAEIATSLDATLTRHLASSRLRSDVASSTFSGPVLYVASSVDAALRDRQEHRIRALFSQAAPLWHPKCCAATDDEGDSDPNKEWERPRWIQADSDGQQLMAYVNAFVNVK